MAPKTTAPENDASREKSPSLTSVHNPREPVLPQHVADVANGTSGGKRKSLTPPIKPAGESGRQGIHPLHFFRIIWHSTSTLSRAVNILWPVVPAAIAVYYAVEDHHTLKFILAYIAMVPCANLIGFAGQQLARKMPHVMGVLVETTVASIVEIVLFMVLLVQGQPVLLQGAILGSILATMLLCLGLCFFASGLRREDSTFDEVITEAGSGLLLTAGVGLAIPAIFRKSTSGIEGVAGDTIDHAVLNISRLVAILLLLAYAVFLIFQARTHHGLFDQVFQHDEHRNDDREKALAKDKLTLTECVVALAISVGLVTLIAIALVKEIPFLIKGNNSITDPFMGLILVPLVEKAAEHLTAVDEAWDNQMNFALSHCIGSTLQTALLNTPLVVIAAWGRGDPFSLDFEIFNIVMLILAIITVGNFLRDQSSNYLEGFLLIVTYVAIAVAAFYYPAASEGAAAVIESIGH